MSTDKFTVRAVIVSLALFGFIALLGGIYLAAVAKPVPDFLIATGAAAVGALGAVLARTSTEGPVITGSHADVDMTTGDVPNA